MFFIDPQLNEPIYNIHKYDLWAQSVKWYTIYKIFEGLGIIYLVTAWVILVSVNSKSFHQSKQKPTIWSDIFRWKFEVLELLCYLHTYIIHLWLRFSASFWWINLKFYKLEFGIACCFNILVGIWHIRYFFYILPSHHLNLRGQH